MGSPAYCALILVSITEIFYSLLRKYYPLIQEFNLMSEYHRSFEITPSIIDALASLPCLRRLKIDRCTISDVVVSFQEIDTSFSIEIFRRQVHREYPREYREESCFAIVERSS